MKPQISVVIPAYNAEKYLAEAIQSVLSQNYDNLEIILVDDGSTDKTKAIAESFSIKVYSIDHKGIGFARNYGIRKSQAEIISFIDSDDLWMLNKLNHQITKLNDQCDIVFGKMENFISPDVIDIEDSIDFPKGIQLGFHPGAMLVKKKVFETIGFFREDIKVGEFVDWFSRAREKSVSFVMLDELVLKRRIHSSNTTRIVKDTAAEYLKIAISKIKK